jgi:hypothetical protein
MKRNFVRELLFERVAVYVALLFAFGELSGNRTYFSDRNYKFVSACSED